MNVTKVIPALLACLKLNCVVGKVTANHILAINEETQSGINSVIDLATEVKAVILMIHNCPEGFVPMKLICIHPQTTNESAHIFKDHVYNVLKRHEKFQVVSYCMDGVSFESKWISKVLISFLDEKTKEIAFVDGNHVAKAVRNQILSETELKTIGSNFIQPRKFALASLNIPKDIYKVKDFAFDALVLGICDLKLIKKIIKADVDACSFKGIIIYTFLNISDFFLFPQMLMIFISN